MSSGNIVQCIGAVVDVKFPRESLPKVFEALVLDEANSGNAESGLTFEVQQQLGDGIVRTIALGSTDGLRRGMKVKGSGGVTLKRGTLVKNIRLTGDTDEIEANVDKVRGLVLRVEFVKKA